MRSLFVIIFTTLLLVSLQGSHGADWTDICGSALGKVPRFTEFILFPNPVQVGQKAFVRTVVSLPDLGEITGGIIKVNVKFNGADALMLGNISLCNSTSSIACSSLVPGNNALNFDFMVPQIPVGTYTISVYVTLYPSSSTGCLTFTMKVEDPTQTGNVYKSWIQASLAGTAQFENPNIANRAIGDVIQIGPIGPAPEEVAYTSQWGTFLSIAGSEDTILPAFSSSNYVWGLSGTITEVVYSPKLRNHTYEGTFYIGYVSDLSKRKLDVEIIEGHFKLSMVYALNSDKVVIGSSLSGSVYFYDDLASIPSGWTWPVTVGAFAELELSNNPNGLFMVSGSKLYCLNPGKDCSEQSAIMSPAPKSSNGLSDRDIGLIVGLVVGVPAVAGLIIALLFWRRHRKQYDEEDGIFSSTRKPEYGNALVVDDIIQETREHGASPTLIPRLDRHPGDSDSEDDYSDDDDSESQVSRQRRDSRFSRDDDRSYGRSRSPESRGSRGRRSRSPERRRTRSPSRSSYSDSYDSDDAGSSASRTSSD